MTLNTTKSQILEGLMNLGAVVPELLLCSLHFVTLTEAEEFTIYTLKNKNKNKPNLT